MLSVDGDADAAVEARIRIGWNKFRQLVPLLTNKDVSLIMRGRLYSSCVWSSMLHGSETKGRPKRTWKEVVREDCQARKLTKEDAVDHCKWRKVIKEVRWPGWVWVGECFFWYKPTRVVPDKRPLNGCCCCCCTNVSLSAVLAAVPAWCLIW